jgi:hypothetical protein
VNEGRRQHIGVFEADAEAAGQLVES